MQILSEQYTILSPELSKRFSLTVSVIAGVIYMLTNKGTTEKMLDEQFIAERATVSLKSVSRAKRILANNGYLIVRTVRDEKKKLHSYIQLTNKYLTGIRNTYGQEDVSSEIPNVRETLDLTSDRREIYGLDDVRPNVRETFKKEIESKYKVNIKVNIGSKNEKMTNEEWNEFKNEVPLPTDDDFERDGALSEKGNSIVLDATATASAVAPKKKSSAKRERVITKAPQSIEETEELVRRFQKQNADVPNMDKLDVRGYAREIFSYYGAPYDDGKWRDGKGTIIKVPMRSVSGWINRDYKRNGKYKLQEGMEDVNPECEALFEKYQKLADQNKQNSNEPVETQFEFVNNIETPMELPNMDYETMFLPRAKEN